MNAVQTGFVDAATAASVKATKAIAAAETLERKAVAKADVVLAQDLQSAWGTYAAAERSAVTLNARERATIGADFKKEVAGAELAAIKAVAPARKTSMVATAEANGVYHVKVTGIIADLGILGGEIKVEQVKASHSLISPATLKKWLDLLSTCGDIAAAAAKGLAQGAANLGNAVQDVGVSILNVPAASVNFGSSVSETLFFDVPDHMKIRLPYIPSPGWSKGLVTQESDFDHNVSKGCLEVAVGIFGSGAIGKLKGAARLNSFVSVGPAGAIYDSAKPLTSAQRTLLSRLSASGTDTVIAKRAVSMNDLRNLTLHTGDEFAMLTRRGERMIFRGVGGAEGTLPSIPTLTVDRAREFAAQGWRFSGHTHTPGFQAVGSVGDKAVLRAFGQKQSAVWGANWGSKAARFFAHFSDEIDFKMGLLK